MIDRSIAPEIFSTKRDDVGEELHLDPTSRQAANGDIEEDDRVLGIGWSQMPFQSHSRPTTLLY